MEGFIREYENYMEFSNGSEGETEPVTDEVILESNESNESNSEATKSNSEATKSNNEANKNSKIEAIKQIRQSLNEVTKVTKVTEENNSTAKKVQVPDDSISIKKEDLTLILNLLIIINKRGGFLLEEYSVVGDLYTNLMKLRK